MTLPKQKFRELVFQILYSKQVGHTDDASIVTMMMTELSVTKKNVREAMEKVIEITKLLPQIDAMITSASPSYDFDRIQTVTKNILRLSLYEIFFEKLIPPKVAIAESIRLSKKFCTLESSKFVNALLDYLYQVSIGEPTSEQEVKEHVEELLNSELAASKASEDLPQFPTIQIELEVETEDDNQHEH